MSNNKQIKDLVEVDKEAMSITSSHEQVLNLKQLNYIFKQTPAKHIYERPGKGGGKWKFVTGAYVKKMLNYLFGWNWSFSILKSEFDLDIGQAYVHGKLTCTSNGITVVREQFGRSEIKFRKQTQQAAEKGEKRIPLDIGNDLKAAATDALKKCASELGIAADVYAPNEFQAIKIVENEKLTEDEKLEKIKDLLETEGLRVNEDDRMNYLRVVDEKEVASYDKAIMNLNKALPVKK